MSEAGSAATRRYMERKRLGLFLEPLVCPTCGQSFRHQGALTPHVRSHERSIEESVWARVDRSAGPDACWSTWTGGRFKSGYGVFSNRVRNTTAHRVVLELTLGRPLGEDVLACHTCDNPPCCNPAHLFEGSARDNGLDASAKGRTSPQRHPERYFGARPWRKLTDAAALAIRARHAAGGVSLATLAREYGVVSQCVANVVHGRTWTRAQP